MTRRKCSTGKVGHPNITLATVAAKNHHRSLNARGIIAESSYAYRCRSCRSWHLTHRAAWNDHANRLVLRAAPAALQEWAMP